MRALFILQPWAHLIIHADKNIENRNWNTSFRGRFAVHASKRKSIAEFYAAEQLAREKNLTKQVFTCNAQDDQVVYGAVIGTVELVDVVTRSTSPWFVGPYGFVLANPKPLLVPILVKGALGFWEWQERRCTSIACNAYGEPIAEGHCCIPSLLHSLKFHIS